jgi:hypothetical protein
MGVIPNVPDTISLVYEAEGRRYTQNLLCRSTPGVAVHGRATVHLGWWRSIHLTWRRGHSTHVRWDVCGASLSMLRVKGQSAHIKLISHDCLAVCLGVSEGFSVSVRGKQVYSD